MFSKRLYGARFSQFSFLAVSDMDAAVIKNPAKRTNKIQFNFLFFIGFCGVGSFFINKPHKEPSTITIGKIQGDLKKRKVNTPKTRTIILEKLVFKSFMVLSAAKAKKPSAMGCMKPNNL